MSSQELKKHLTTRSIFAFGIAGMIASGLFLLPGLIYSKMGGWAHWVYIASGIMIIPTLFSKAELATAMPRSGGAYYILDRSLGPAVGTVAGLGTWLSLIFKSSFDLIGLGAYILLFLVFPITPVAIGLCIGFGILCLVSTKGVSRMQEGMVAILLAGIGYFLLTGVFNIDHGQIPMQQTWNTTAFLESIGLVYVSFASLIKILSMAGETVNQDHSIPNGMFTSVLVTLIIYIVGMTMIMKWVPAELLSGTLTPVADAAGQMMGKTGIILFSALAFLAFGASANAGLTAATRYPYALSLDRLMPRWFHQLNRFNTPTYSIIVTVVMMICFVLMLSAEGMAKMASAFILIIFGMLNLAVIVMRESRITAYDPGFKSPAYPWMQIAGLITSIILIPYLGLGPRMAAALLVGLGLLWYFLYGQKRRKSSSALEHLFSHLGSSIDRDIEHTLRHNLRLRGLKSHDSLEDVLYRAPILRHKPHTSFDDILIEVADHFSERLNLSMEQIFEALKKSDTKGKTPVHHHIALPHAYIPGIDHQEVAIIQSPSGITLSRNNTPVYALFILVGPKESPKQHLRLLAEIANRAEEIDIEGEWRNWDISRIREEFVHAEHIQEITLSHPHLYKQPVNHLWIHPECLIAFIERSGDMIIPHTSVRLQQGDNLVLIGSKTGVDQTRNWIKNPTYKWEPIPPRSKKVG